MPKNYSADLVNVTKQMLTIDRARRPTVAGVMKLAFIQKHLEEFGKHHEM